MCTPQGIIEHLGCMVFNGALKEATKAGKYVCHYRRNLETLQTEMTFLEDRRTIIERKVKEAKDCGEVINEDVLHWQRDTDTMKDNVQELVGQSTGEARIHCFACSCPNVKWRYRLSIRAEEKIDKVKKLVQDSHFDEISHRRPPPRELEFPSNENYVNMDSRKPIFNNIVDALKDSDVNMIGVYGPGGVGKTTLVIEVGNKMGHDGYFKQVSLATIPKGLKVEAIQSQLAEGLNFAFDPNEGSRAVQLWNKLADGERYLIILDDIWEKVDFKAIGIPIADENKSCKVLLTSRDEDLLLIKMKVHCFKMVELPEKEAWDLFQKKVGNSFGSYTELDSVAHDVCKRCEGLPVAINAIGAALEGKSDFAWKDALVKLEKYELMNIEGVDSNVWASLKLSYDLLQSSNAKSIFLLCCLFREDAEIPIGELTRHCLARRLVSQNPRTLEEVGNSVRSVVGTLKSASLL
ncbi:hypothetical protein Vadar_016011 [Vaccinium darrowii]|uniref:Uncharacterized protein n=1 Tax=Vaccinium darrowii TaxID=229202 RepID=A0ACB7XR12_9ERIC|nr:hypothetical protein Vadar_016011 [Vaccinium darrowii]